MSRLRTFFQSVGLFAVLGLASTSIAGADPVAPAGISGDPASADTAQGGPLADVPAGHWAYDAVSQLVKDGLIVGYPDGQFKGNRPMTRYEAAVLTYRAVDQIEAQITAGKAVNQADIDTVRKLMAAFAHELTAVEADVAALQSKVGAQSKQLSDLKSEADATQLRVNQGKLGFQLLVRPGTSSYTLNGVTATGATIAAGKSIAFGTGAANTATTGSLGTGIAYDLARVFLGGQIDPRWSYGVRLSDAVKYSPFDATTIAPSYCAGATAYTAPANCAYTALNYGTTPPQNTLPINLDYAYTQYSSPGGFTSQIGRYVVNAYGKFGASPDASLLFGGAGITGANLGFNDPHGHFYATFYYGQQSVNDASLLANGTNTNAGAGNLTCTQAIYGLNATSAGNGINGQGHFTGINPYCTAQQSEEAGWLVYYFSNPRIAVGGAMDNQQGKQYTFYNQNQVTCTVAAGATKGVYQAASTALCNANFPTATTSAPTSYFLNGQGNVQDVEGYLVGYFGPKNVPTFGVQFTYDRHLGVNPFTGGSFTGGDAEAAEFTYASKGNLFSGGGFTNPFVSGGGRRGSNVVAISVNRYGLNSLSNIQNTEFSGAVSFENNPGFTNLNGMQAIGLSATHWFTDSIRFGFNAYHLQNNFNSQIPISTGGYVTQVNENQLNGEMYLYFF